MDPARSVPMNFMENARKRMKGIVLDVITPIMCTNWLVSIGNNSVSAFSVIEKTWVKMNTRYYCRLK